MVKAANTNIGFQFSGDVLLVRGLTVLGEQKPEMQSEKTVGRSLQFKK